MRNKFGELWGSKVRLVEMALRDGLQNEATTVSIADRIELAKKLVDAGVKNIELGSFVRSDKIPQMQGTAEIVGEFLKTYPDQTRTGVKASVLVPNMKGLEFALDTGIQEIAVFTSVSESFAKSNINCSIAESFERFEPVIAECRKRKIKVRGYLSTVFGCPFEGAVDQSKAIELATRLWKLGCYEVSLGDTIGVATPSQVFRFLKELKRKMPLTKVAGHFHDTRGTALANILAALQAGVFSFDTSLGGIGGCPYAPGASGNVATEDVLYMMNGMGLKTGLDLKKLVLINHWFAKVMGRPLNSAVAKSPHF